MTSVDNFNSDQTQGGEVSVPHVPHVVDDDQPEEEEMMGLYDDNDVDDHHGDDHEGDEQKLEAENVNVNVNVNVKEGDMNNANAADNTIVAIGASKSSEEVQTMQPSKEVAAPAATTPAVRKESPIRQTTATTAVTPSSAHIPTRMPSSSTSTSTSRPNQTPMKQANNEIEALNDEIATLLLTNKITLTTSSKLQTILRENVSLKEKINKLKTLLSRSSKVSKETKVELDKSQREVMRLNHRVDLLANRPTHMDLLADFETNFDRALMNLHSSPDGTIGTDKDNQYSQSGGEDTRAQQLSILSPNSNDSFNNTNSPENVSTLLLTELSQTKARMDQLEQLNTQLVKRTSQLDKEKESCLSQMERQKLKMSNLQLELRMAKMETDNATREMKAKAASLVE